MRVDLSPSDEADASRLPERAAPPQADAARDRLLERVVAGGLAPAAAPEAERIGPYRLGRRLGRGGMGDVFEATKDGDPTPVAIKVLRAAVAAHEPTRRRFLREAKTAAEVRHPRIVHILDVGTTNAQTPYLVMERLTGEPLETVLREHGALPWPTAFAVLRQVAEAMAFAHGRGVVHRDLKPANVMVQGGLDAPHCTIIDFGLARREVIASGSESLSHTGEVFGSPPFMSPEQFRGDTADARSDQYSFGCLMFAVLTGRRPFEGDKIGDLMYRHLFEPAPAPDGMRAPARLRPALSSIVVRCLRKAPDRRFSDMDEVVAILDRLDADPRPVEVPDDDVALPLAPAPARAGRRALPWLVAASAVVVGAIAATRDVPARAPVSGVPERSAGSSSTPRIAPQRPPSSSAATNDVPPPAATVGPPPAEDPPPAEPEAEPPERAPPQPESARSVRRVRPESKRAPEPTEVVTPEPSAPPPTPPGGSELPPNPFHSPPPDAPDDPP